MLTREENELLTRVGPGTPMGGMLRRYWIPACLSEELPESDCDPIRVRLLGEDLVAFRDSSGRPGVLEEYCPHRGASLHLGRNEEGGLRCIYHGWKMDVDGNVLDMPCEPEGSTFKERVKAVAYPVREQGRTIWVYMGPREHMPPFPNFEWTLVPDGNRSIAKVMEEANWLQAVEGTVDSSHADVLHNGADTLLNRDPNRPADTKPEIGFRDTAYGFWTCSWRRHQDDPEHFNRVHTTNMILPFFCLVPPRGHYHIHSYVPMDDTHTWDYSIYYSPTLTINHEKTMARRTVMPGVDLYPDRRKIRNLSNDYGQDRQAMRERRSFSGIGDNPHEDHGIQESMGPILDRSREHLGAVDVGIIHLRQVLLEAVRGFQRGEPPLGIAPSIAYDQIRSLRRILPREVPWTEAYDYPAEDIFPEYAKELIE
ncbi:MAG: (2Fe-2S)-binding protein [Chloroflexi bacterium]|nr:(2Fe-2S)-binding protein [Chloroflexota bacterium]